MTNNVPRLIEGHLYFGVICTFEESKSLLHPDNWNEIPIGYKKCCDNGIKIIHYDENTMLFRKGNKRYFIQLVQA